MSNNYFQFKQFTIQQEKAALKVSTDSCLFGAWVSSYLSAANRQPATILDIGAGTGLLMLMLAQKSTALIDGIEIDPPSFEQAQENIVASPWKERLNLFNADVKEFSFDKQYDFIISNPPFYEGDLKSFHQHKNVAKHDAGLTLEELINVIDRNLSALGSFAVLLPYHRTEVFISIAEKKNYYLAELVRVKQSFKHKYFRSILLFGRKQSDKKESVILIKEESDVYSADFIALLKDYYLFL